MQLLGFLALLTTAECLVWSSFFSGTSRHTGLEASAGVLRLTMPGHFEESIQTVTREEVPLEAEARELASGLHALQPQSSNMTQAAIDIEPIAHEQLPLELTAKCSAELYQHGDFSGWKVVFPLGEYNHQQMVDKGAANDEASSIKVIGMDCHAVVYEHGDFTGWKVVFSEGEYQHYEILKNGVQNDALSAIQVFQGFDDMLNVSTANSESSMQGADARPATPSVETEPDPRAVKIKSERSVEGNLIESLRHTSPNGEEAVECVTKCRYGEARLEWQDCLDWCVENPIMRSTLLAMLPKENQKAHAQHVEIPEILKRRQEQIKQRSSEL